MEKALDAQATRGLILQGAGMIAPVLAGKLGGLKGKPLASGPAPVSEPQPTAGRPLPSHTVAESSLYTRNAGSEPVVVKSPAPYETVPVTVKQPVAGLGLTAAERDAILAAGKGPRVDVLNTERVLGGKGPISGRAFEPENAGGVIRDLNTDRVRVTERGIEVVRKHVSRFGQDDVNDFMINRLERISRGDIPADQVDLNFYTHELREYVRYRRLGWETGVPKSQDEAYRLWNNAHTATLEEYRLNEKMTPHPLYHPDAP
ncbi:hypothetical protein HNQ59_003963 [Chitinivorax tropicus]|uniref:Uncharacterized protein n=1 Tax=Chitinivorax tropicus TaxID=714531 RepID=A0A840MPS5_9PROT|nr:hypothetical protein [Chitinivorax tropicus]MBB5020638.1 hypothetical protein [Chitinivorax tropicus]